jgi:hypothetical protein
MNRQSVEASSAAEPIRETPRDPKATDYRQWKKGLPADPTYFPIAVWLQNPANAARYKAAGINLYVALWQGPTEEQLAALKKAGMPVICDQNAVGLAHRDDPTIVGWMHGDEPDNAQPIKDPVTGKTSYGPCIPPPKIVADYERMRATDPTRPVLLNLGQGVANDSWIGRGSGASLKDYETYVKGGDLVSFDVYPVADLRRPDGEEYLWYVAKGVSRLGRWTGGKRRVWSCIECTRISGAKRATPTQVRAEVWMALIHGASGLIYFVHEFQPKFNEYRLLDDPEMLPAVTAINREIRELAPALNSPTLPPSVASVTVEGDSAPIALTARHHGGATYLFTVGMRNRPARGAFTLARLPARASAEVIGENRALPVRDGKFTDALPPYGVRLYRIR